MIPGEDYGVSAQTSNVTLGEFIKSFGLSTDKVTIDDIGEFSNMEQKIFDILSIADGRIFSIHVPDDMIKDYVIFLKRMISMRIKFRKTFLIK